MKLIYRSCENVRLDFWKPNLENKLNFKSDLIFNFWLDNWVNNSNSSRIMPDILRVELKKQIYEISKD